MHRGYVDTPDGQIHYRMAGESGPTVFCLHESPVSSWEFERTLPLLGARCRAIAFDTPGYGLSDPPPGPIDIPEYARRMLPAIEHFAPGGRFAFATVHTGTSIALELITEHLAERTTHAIFSGVPMIKPEQVAAFTARIGEPTIDAEGDFLKDMWATRRKNWGEDTDLETIHAAIAQHLAIYPRFHWAFQAVFSYDAEAALKKIRCPLYVINAEGDSLAQIDKAAAALVPGVQFKLVPGIGGQLPFRAPEIYAREVLNFIGA
ncbi:MAG: alpha/beta hydrolase [Alphaproteobacteria bacterium]|nr:alpha/beta hydrolase [Alphaproteobacteria bacterium]